MREYVEIPLSQGYVALVDADEPLLEYILARKWSVLAPRNRNTQYAVAFTAANTKSGRSTIRMHKVITGWKQTDHIDGNGLNNRRSNLRPATTAENARNRGPNSNNTSGYKGVTFSKRSGKWAAQIYYIGSNKHLGFYDSPREAAYAYDAAAVRLHGEFAWTNFPRSQSFSPVNQPPARDSATAESGD